MVARDDADAPLAPLPPLARSFAVFGAAAGFFAVLGVGALNEGSLLVHPGVAAACSGVSGALFGALLRRSRAIRNPFLARENVLIRLGAALAIAGALAGLAIGAVTIAWRPNGLGGKTVTASSLVGGVVGVLLLPACAAVFDAALRASRARLGSVVSRADQGRVQFTLFATMSLLALCGVPPVALGASSEALGPEVQLLFSVLAPLACLAAVLVSSYRTKRAARQLDALARKREECAPAEVSDASSPLLCDLGLGDERWSKVRPTHAYRGARDASVVLRGSVDDARHAIRETTTLGRGALLVASATTAFIALSAAGAMLFTHRRPWVSLSEVNVAQAPFPPGNLHVVWAAQWPPAPASQAFSVNVSDAPLAMRDAPPRAAPGAFQGRRAEPFIQSSRPDGSSPSRSPQIESDGPGR